MSLLTRALTVSHVVMNVSVSVGFLFMSYFWYQNGRSVRESREDRQQYRILIENSQTGRLSEEEVPVSKSIPSSSLSS